MADSHLKAAKRVCSLCRVELDISCFSLSNRSTGARHRVCKPCRSGYERKRLAAKRGDRREISCQNCGALFIPLQASALYCAPACANAARLRRGRERRSLERLPRPCIVCGEVFEPPYRTSKTCGAKCNRKAHYEANKERYLELAYAWRRANTDAARAVQRSYQLRVAGDPERLAKQRRVRVLAEGKRRAAVAATGHISRDRWEQRSDYFGHRCWVCRAVATQIDHVKPLSQGGPHILANLRPICARCNQRKGARWPFDGSFSDAERA
jgi:5-methylcytosine-specific restriction endonuclease McrA